MLFFHSRPPIGVGEGATEGLRDGRQGAAVKSVLGFMHQPDEPKSLSYWEDVGNPLILHNTPTHMQPE